MGRRLRCVLRAHSRIRFCAAPWFYLHNCTHCSAPPAILFLVSREARWITGVIFPVDGGTTAGNPNRPALQADTLVAEQTAAARASS